MIGLAEFMHRAYPNKIANRPKGDKMNLTTIKSDLRQLKKTIHIIEALENAQERYIKRIETLSRLVQTEKIKEQIESTKRVMSLMNIETYIKEANQLESKYMCAINKLEPIERTIILDCFINGLPHWQIGLNLGYTQESVRKKIDKILRKLLKLL